METETLPESLDQLQARHRKEQKELQGRITSKKKNATKKTRKGINDECAQLERQLKDKHDEETRQLRGGDAGAAQLEMVVVEEHATEAIANGAMGLSLDSPAAEANGQRTEAPIPAQTLGGGAGGTGKKRNRQKERLARRAAEQEAAATAAEEEAATMVDHRGRESDYMKREMAAHALVEKDIRPDGHCLFSAVADQLGEQSGPLSYKDVRGAAAGYMLEHADDFAPFLDEPLAQYAAKIRDTAEWGGQLELAALASRYGVEIRVLQDGRTEVVQPRGDGDGDGIRESKAVWLAYYRHGYGLGEHYNSLRKAP